MGHKQDFNVNTLIHIYNTLRTGVRYIRTLKSAWNQQLSVA